MWLGTLFIYLALSMPAVAPALGAWWLAKVRRDVVLHDLPVRQEILVAARVTTWVSLAAALVVWATMFRLVGDDFGDALVLYAATAAFAVPMGLAALLLRKKVHAARNGAVTEETFGGHDVVRVGYTDVPVSRRPHTPKTQMMTSAALAVGVPLLVAGLAIAPSERWGHDVMGPGILVVYSAIAIGAVVIAGSPLGRKQREP